MRIRRLKLGGFKSFVEPAELRIEPGLTGVVGPNGCGKSNLLEALRWVMGANSAKAMRAGGMDEVIFAGSGNRPSRNHAEVALTIDNADRRAPAAFNEHPVIEVVRRIDSEPGFKVLPRRWVVERSFGWMIRWRRLVRDYERRLDVSEAMIHVSMGALLLRRIAHP